MKKSLLPMNAMLVGCESPFTTVFTDRLGSVIAGPAVGELTAVCRLTELSARSGSFSDAATFALFVSVPADWGTTTMLITVAAFRASEPRVHVTVVVPPHEPCVGVADTKFAPAGKLS